MGDRDFGWVKREDPKWSTWRHWDDRILVMTSDGPLVVRIPEDGLPEYEKLDEFADPDEWTAWSHIPKVEQSTNQKPPNEK